MGLDHRPRREAPLPRLKAEGVRFVEVARRGPSLTSDGLAVLSDSRAPIRLHPDAAFALSDELLAAGTIPTSGGTRKCSLKSKGEVLDAWTRAIIEGPFHHAIGFAVGEACRVVRDQVYGKAAGRMPFYPLIEWGWDRARCEAFILGVTGVRWPKSACVFCPFSRGTDEVLNRYRNDRPRRPEPSSSTS